MKKTLVLYRAILKCSSQTGELSTSSKVGYAILGVLVVGLLGFCGYMLGKFATIIKAVTGLNDIVTPIFMVYYALIGLAVFFMAIPMLLKTMFMSTDIDVLAAMPLSATQIALARVMAGCPILFLVSAGATIPLAVGLCITAGFNLMLIISAIVAAIVIPFGSASLAAILLTLIMKAFRSIRNRDLMTWIGAIAGVLLVAIICMFSNSSGASSENQWVNIISSAVNIADYAWIVPQAACCGYALSAGPLYLLLGVAIAAVICGLAYLVLSKLYLPTALAMVNSKGKSNSISSEGLEKATVSQSVEKALLRKEIKTYFKNPSYITSWAMAAILPLILIIPGIVNREADGSFSGLCGIMAHAAQMEFGVSLAGGVLFGLALTFIATAMSTAGTSCISREGEGFDFMKTIPVKYTVQLDAKRKVTIIALGIPSTLVIVLFGIVGMILGPLSWSYALGALLANLGALVLVANLQMRTAAKKANIHWDNAQAALKSSVLWLVVGILLFFVFEAGAVALSIFAEAMNLGTWALIGGLVVILGLAVLAFATTRPCLKYAAEKISKLN